MVESRGAFRCLGFDCYGESVIVIGTCGGCMVGETCSNGIRMGKIAHGSILHS